MLALEKGFNFNLMKYSTSILALEFEEQNYCDELLRNRMLNELFHEVVPVILKHDDLNSMFYSIENRSPYLDRDLIDYDIVVKKAPETEDYTCGLGELDKTLPASYCSIKSVEEGIEWYKHKNPEYPDSFCEILARYTWGKKEDDEEKDKKKKKRKNKKKANKFRVRQGNFKLEF